ncbi:MAG: hypothetical protein H7319_04935 [Spirosoma sp.]|nr:hypothetical protein [Spirosoma sp.]
MLRKDLTNRTHPDELRPALSTFLREHLQLPMADPRPGVWPDRLVCCGRLTLTANPADAENPSVIVTVGNTSTEAVSAYLADRLSKSKKIEVEEYLEALQYLSRLDHLQTDVGPKLREERHRQGFSSEKGGTRWVFVPRQATGGQAEQAVEQTTLTDDKAHFLHLLNEFQLAFDRTDEQVKALRQQIFADWTKYMLCQYPPDGADDNYPDADEARFFIDYELMPALDQLNEQRQQAAKALRDHVAGFWHFRVGDVRAPAGLYAGLVQLPDVAPYLSAAAGGSEAALVQCLNMYIDQQGYHDPMAQRADGVHTWTLEEILERQHYETHLRTNRLRLENGFPNNLAQHPDLVLLRKPHSPFHRPTDPVVMLTGDALKTTRKHGQDGMLTNELWVLNGRNLLDEAARIAPQLIPEDWQRPPGRHPLLLDWLVEFFPVEDTDFNFDRYEPNYLLDKYELALNAVDLSATKTDLNATGPQLYTGVGQTFWGSCLLATGGSKSLRQSLETFLMGELGLTEADLTEPAKIRQTFFQNDSGKDAWLNSYQQDKGTAASPDTFDDFYSWEPSRWKPDGPPPAELAALWTTKHKALAVLAYEQLCQTDFLAQALGGFTPALLMLKEGVQLRVADPLGYPEYQAFSERVNEAVGLLNQASTLPNNPFFPIRAGAAKLLELRLLDTFGLDIVHLRDIQGVITAETLRPQHSAHHVELTPRLSQAARLNFHWLSATDNAVEQSEHPASSPICGWVLANLMDESLMIYAQTGAALGYVDREGHWRSAPGQRPAIMAEGIPNWHLRRMVLWLIAKAKEARLPTDGKSDTIPHFIEQLSQALIRVEPPRSDHAGEGVAMLMSRPLALVRATVSLELKGAPAVNQSWAQFRQVIESPEQDRESTLDLERVALPLRIGEDHQLNDGLVGFWVDANDGYAYRDDAFRMPSLHRATSGTRDYTDDHLLDTMTLGANGNRGRAMTLNLLMDPHGSVHATCGILPVNELSLPPDLYAKALEQLEITFLTAPLLTPQQMIHLSLPPEPGFQWAWVDTDRQRWREVSTVGHFRRDELVAAFGGAGTLLWDQLIERGWVTLEGEQAVIVPPGRRPATDDFPPTQLAPLLDHFLATRQINPFQMVPGGNSGQELREGWLRLRPLPDSPLLPETDQPTPA